MKGEVKVKIIEFTVFWKPKRGLTRFPTLLDVHPDRCDVRRDGWSRLGFRNVVEDRAAKDVIEDGRNEPLHLLTFEDRWSGKVSNSWRLHQNNNEQTKVIREHPYSPPPSPFVNSRPKWGDRSYCPSSLITLVKI